MCSQQFKILAVYLDMACEALFQKTLYFHYNLLMLLNIIQQKILFACVSSTSY